jgi:hypothetical protein
LPSIQWRATGEAAPPPGFPSMPVMPASPHVD